MISRWTSRKLLITLISIALVALNKKLELQLSEEAVLALAGLSASYVLGVAYKESKQSDG